MKRSVILFSAMALFAINGAFAQESTRKAPKAKTTTAVSAVKKTAVAPKVDGPGIVFESETMDYGTIEHNSDGKRDFVFTNNGTKPLIITSAQGSCGCTVPTYPKEPIAPGAKGVISVKYDTNREGAFTKTVTLGTNVSDEKKMLTIKGTVKPNPNKETPKS